MLALLLQMMNNAHFLRIFLDHDFDNIQSFAFEYFSLFFMINFDFINFLVIV